MTASPDARTVPAGQQAPACWPRRRCGWSARRLLAAIPVLWGVTLLTFIVVQALPGNAAQQLLGPNATPEQVAAARGSSWAPTGR